MAASPKPKLRLTEYPRLERLDLTQSQLNDFKFTPVDPVDPDDEYNNNPIIRAAVDDATKYIFAESAIRIQGYRDLTARKKQLDRWLARQHAAAAARAAQMADGQDPDAETGLSQRHPKSDLETSRLQLGSTIFRHIMATAATSPPRPEQRVVRFAESENITSQQSYETQLPPKYTTSIAHHTRHSSDMDPSAPSFVPRAEIVEKKTSVEELSIHTEVCHALVEEQRAHCITKMALKEEKRKLVEAEEETSRLSSQSESLTKSVNLLGNIIKDNLDDLTNEFGPLKSMITRMQTSFNDAQARRLARAAQKAAAYSHEHIASQVDGWTRGEDQIVAADNQQLHQEPARSNPSPMNHLDHSDRGVQSLAFAFQEHFSVPTVDADITSGRNSGKNEESLSPEIENESNDERAPLTQSDSAATGDQASQTHISAPQAAFSSLSTPFESHNHSQKQSRFQLPAAFLEKYRWNKQTMSSPVKESADSTLDLIQTKLEKLDLAVPDGQLDEKEDREMVEEASPKTNIVDLFNKMELNLNWKIGKDQHVYANEAKHLQIRYEPDLSSPDIFRTIMIDYIPVGSTVKDVLQVIKYGPLLSISLHDPIGRAAPYMSARVVFMSESEASKMEIDAKRHEVTVKGAKVRVWRVPTATAPAKKEMLDWVRKAGATRIVMLISHYPKKNRIILGHIKYLMEATRQVIDCTIMEDGKYLVECASVESSIRVIYLTLVENPEHHDGHWVFQPDYCGMKHEGAEVEK